MQRIPLTSLAARCGAALPATALVALALAGCGGGSNTGTTPVTPPVVTPAVEVLYVADAGNNNIPVIGESASGTVSQLGNPASPPSGNSPQDIAVEPLERFVLVASGNTGQPSARRGGAHPAATIGGTPMLSAYKVNSDGSLPSTPASSVTLPSLTSFSHSAVAATVVSGNVFVYVAGAANDAIYAFQLNTGTGALTPLPNAVPTTGQTPASLLTFSINGTPFLLVGDLSPNVQDFAIGANGTLSSTDVCAAGNAGPVLVAAPQPPGVSSLTQNDVYAYDNGAQTLYSYQVAANGQMTMLPTVSGPGTITSIVANPNGSALYLTQSTGANLYEYPIPTTGASAGQPGALVTRPVSGEVAFQGAVTDGQHLAALDIVNGRVDVFSLNGDGSIGAAGPSYNLASGSDPVAVALALRGVD